MNHLHILHTHKDFLVIWCIIQENKANSFTHFHPNKLQFVKMINNACMHLIENFLCDINKFYYYAKYLTKTAVNVKYTIN